MGFSEEKKLLWLAPKELPPNNKFKLTLMECTAKLQLTIMLAIVLVQRKPTHSGIFAAGRSFHSLHIKDLCRSIVLICMLLIGLISDS